MKNRSIILPVFYILSLSLNANAALNPKRVVQAEGAQKKAFIREGVIVGGDSSLDQVTIHEIRFGKQNGVERLVIDLEGKREGNSPAIDRPPYYQVDLSPEMKRLIFTIQGKPILAFDSAKLKHAIQKSSLISRMDLLPVVEKDRWNLVLELKNAVSVEVFELKKTTRIVMDLKK